MPKINGLRWIPMMIQAYQTAKTRLNSKEPVINIPTSETGSSNSQTISHVRHQPARAAKSQTENRNTLLRSKKLTTKQVSSANRLIRELRSANQKLNRLETIQKQLKEMESMFAGLRKEIQQTTTETKQLEDLKKLEAQESGLPHIAAPNLMVQKENGNHGFL